VNVRFLPHLVLLALVATGSARAEDAGYEDRLVEWALQQEGLERDPQPDAKRIEEIRIRSENVVAPTDPWPRILNIVHVKTKERVIRRELLFNEGDIYDSEVVAESERNLRVQLIILAVARIVPVKGKTAGTVGILVVTKDLWSLRLNTQINTVGSLVQLLHLHPSENNFLGLNQQLALDFLLKLDTMSFGQAFTESRLFGTRLAFSETAAIIVNRSSGKAEGSRGGFTFGQPLYSLATESAFGIAANWQVETSRVYQGATVLQLPNPDPETPGDTIPFIYETREVDAAASYTRSFGRLFKTNVSGLLGAYRRRFTAPLDLGLSDAQRAWLEANKAPRSEGAVYLGSELALYRAEYLVLRNIDTFALSEDTPIGHRLVFQLRWTPGFFPQEGYLEGGASLRYRLYAKDDLATLTLAASARFVPGNTDIPSLVNRRVAAELVNYSPLIGIGRIAFRGLVDVFSEDLNHRFFLLGGGNGLRGTSPEVLSGTKRVLFNLEYRTLPLEFYTLHAGLVVFYDAGSAFSDSTSFRNNFTQTLGIGLRTLFPQFDVETFRIDFGYVVRGVQANSFGDRFSTSFGQVFGYRPVFLDSPLF